MSDQRFDEGARDVENREEAIGLVFGWTPIYERDPANSRHCARVGRLDERAELQIEERFGIRGQQHSCPGRFLVEPRHLPAGVSLKRSCRRADPFFDDGVSHRRVRCEKKVGPSGSRDASRDAIDAREPRVKARYGLRGARVGEASNPGYQARTRFHGTEDAADSAIATLERELSTFDTSDDAPIGQTHGQSQRGAESREREFSRPVAASEEIASWFSFHHSHIIHSASCVKRIAVAGERSSGG